MAFDSTSPPGRRAPLGARLGAIAAAVAGTVARALRRDVEHCRIKVPTARRGGSAGCPRVGMRRQG
jgi:hypothetical protein